jgi:hypothetical protein
MGWQAPLVGDRKKKLEELRRLKKERQQRRSQVRALLSRGLSQRGTLLGGRDERTFNRLNYGNGLSSIMMHLRARFLTHLI